MAYSKVSAAASEALSKKLNYSEEKQQILAYGMEKLIFTSLGFLLIMLMAWLLDVEKEALAAVAAGATLRKFSGGFHRDTALGCLISSVAFYSAAAILAYYGFALFGQIAWFFILFIGMIILIIVGYYAPVDSPHKPIVSTEFKQRLKFISMFVVLFFVMAALVFANSSVGNAFLAGLCLQTITILPILNKRRCSP